MMRLKHIRETAVFRKPYSVSRISRSVFRSPFHASRFTFYVSRFTFHVLWLTALVLLLASCTRQDAAWQRIEQSGVLRVGLDPTYPPFEVADDAGLRGLDVDLMQAIAADLGLTAEFVYFGYDGLYDALATGQVDVLASALVIDPGRQRDFAYSEPYFNAGEILIVRAGSPITAVEDSNLQSLAVELGAQGHVEAIRRQRSRPNLTILPYNTADEAMAAVAAAEANAALVDAISGRLYLSAAPSLTRLPQPVTVEPFALVVRIDDETLLRRLNESLARLQAQGILDQITRRWLDMAE